MLTGRVPFLRVPCVFLVCYEQYNLAICYDEGKGTAKDEKEAAHWYSQVS